MAATLIVAVPSVTFGQRIGGTVSVESEGKLLQGIQVTFLDALNGEVLGSAITNFAGTYDSGLIPAGNYRVRFSDPFGVGTPGLFLSRFFGDAGADSFCGATVVPVALASSAIVNEAMRHFGPSVILLANGEISGFVRSAATGAPLPGIEVRVLDARNASLAVVAITDANGAYAIGIKDSHQHAVRVRFVDPAGVFFPQFFVDAAIGQDDFCAGTSLELQEKLMQVDVWLEPIPAAQLTDDLTGAVESLNLPSNVDSMLRAPLTHAVALLNDTNASNDTGVCAQLTSFISRVNIQERRGQLSPGDASALRASTAAILDALGCR